MRRLPFTTTLLVILAAASCSQQRPPPAATTRAGSAEKQSEASRREGDLVRRKIVRSLDMELLVPSADAFVRTTEQLGASVGGYVSDSTRSDDADDASGSITLRVPAEKLDTAAATLRQAGRVTAESLHADDVSDDYYDLTARLSNARNLESRLLQLLVDRTAKLSDVVEVETKLADVREQIERLEGKRRLWDGQVAMSTIKVQFQVSVAASEPAFSGQLYQTLAGSTRGLKEFAKELALVGIALLPWVPVIVAFLLGVRWLAARRNGYPR